MKTKLMSRFLIFAFVILAPSLAYSEDAAPNTSGDEQTKPVIIDGKNYSYEESLPLLTKMLDGDIKTQIAAAKQLEAYGESLTGSSALVKMLNLLEQTMDLKEADTYFEDSLKNPDAPLRQNVSEHVQDMFNLRMQVLQTVVMSGNQKGIETMKAYIESPSITLKDIGLTVQEVYKTYGSWKLGMKPAKLPPPRFQFPEKKSMSLHEYRELVRAAFASDDLNLVRQTIESLNKQMLNRNAKQIRGIANTPIFANLPNAYKILSDSTNDIELKVLLVKAVAYSGDHKAADFYQEIYKTEKNERVLYEAEKVRLDTLPFIEKEIFAEDKTYPLE